MEPVRSTRMRALGVTFDGAYMVERPTSDAAQLAGRLAMMRAEVRDYAEKPENADIRAQLMEAAAVFERMINHLARPRPPA